MKSLDSRHRGKCFGQRAGQDGNATAATFPIVVESDGGADQLNWPLWLGLFLYGTTFLLYAAALAHLPLNVAHPVLTSGAVSAVAVVSMLFFREPFYWTTVEGFILVIAGVFSITSDVA